MSELEPEHMRKVFVGGLHPETDDEAMKSYFSKYGEILDCIVMKDSQTRRSRGFGFVAFDKSECVDRLQADRPHSLGGKKVDTKRVVPKREQKVNKIFLGGLRDQITDDDLNQYFSQFGAVERVETFTDKETNKRKGFCFITFQDFDSVDKCVLQAQIAPEGKLNLQGVKVEVKKAKSQDEMRRGGGAGRGGRGGFNRGDYGQGYNNQSNYGGGYNNGGGFNQGYNNGGFNQGGGGFGSGNNYGSGGGSSNPQQNNWSGSSGGGGFQNSGGYGGGNSGGFGNSGSYGGGSNSGYGGGNNSGYASGNSSGYGGGNNSGYASGNNSGYASGGYSNDNSGGYGNSAGGGPMRGFNKPNRSGPYDNNAGGGGWNRT
ncbi:heterogeneous nuclear ribonucleoprotein 87F-like isoform X2 [Watersipora subatra]|uniref:heterogeneous nuclear ribonucleoprotein 87F-like isoform X2 n=1 Tax=Watersipora subatra TaxID=2589382 RepID=UPI00355B3502